ncbi:MAG: hypothetical protein ACP5R5_12335 [Armatimonadota bacterium]
MKLGQYIDTFLALMLLTEVKGRMSDNKGNSRVDAALSKVIRKMEKNQSDDGTWANQGWAPVLAQSVAVQAINKTAQKGVNVDEKIRERAERYSRQQFDAISGRFKGEGSAGVYLYSAAGNLAAIQQSTITNKQMRARLEKEARQAPSTTARKAAKDKLARFRAADADLDSARKSIIARLDDKDFISGFGSNGGEDFLSYLNISESLVARGGKE